MVNYQTNNPSHSLQVSDLWSSQTQFHVALKQDFLRLYNFRQTSQGIHFTDKSRQSYLLLFGTWQELCDILTHDL